MATKKVKMPGGDPIVDVLLLGTIIFVIVAIISRNSPKQEEYTEPNKKLEQINDIYDR